MFKVMIVDDMDIIRMELKRFPSWGEKTGFYISEEAKNGADALEKLNKDSVDMVITDIKMPKIDGIELLEQLIEKNYCSCVVLMSDFSEFSYARQGIILGAFDYLVKPVKEEDLNNLLQRAEDFLNNRKKEIERVKRLETALGEKTENFFNDEDISFMIDIIQSRDIHTIDSVMHFIERIIANLDFDIVKVEVAMRKGLPQVLSRLIDKNGWLEKFVDFAALNKDMIYKFNDIASIKTFIRAEVHRITDIFTRFQYGYKEKGIEWQVCCYVLDNIDGDISLKTVADNLFMNKTYISEVFKQKTGISFIEYLTMVKMERAKILISLNNLKTYEIAEKIGYKDAEYFSKVFKKYTGMSPIKYKMNEKTRNFSW